jgi:hypothetical protein
MTLGAPPDRARGLLQAVKLGLEVENDVRVARDRIARLKLPSMSTLSRPPYMTDNEEFLPIVPPSRRESSSSNSMDHSVRTMPLL